MHLFLYMDKTTKTQIYAFFLPLQWHLAVSLYRIICHTNQEKSVKAPAVFHLIYMGLFPVFLISTVILPAPQMKFNFSTNS